ncbi:MAG: efflux RND transporter periplasmic adaptor subunit [Planctomycetaceae bacterium]|nr:efflux RND transporter periplasmic adaptor subunit [Planctomycetaceae bacterium]
MILQLLKQQTSNLLVLGSLAGLALWGHETDWTFSVRATNAAETAVGPTRKSAAANSAAETNSVEKSHDDASDNRLALPVQTEQQLRQTGIVVGRPEQRAMHEEISAHALVTYMQTRTAQLSARVPGAVWSVHCEVGDWVKEDDVLAILDAAEVGQAKANFLQSLVAADVAEATFNRLKSIGDAVPENRVLEVEALFRRAVVERFNAQQALINLGLPIQAEALIGLSDVERARRVQFLGLPDRVTRGLDPRSTTANLLPIVAPFDGEVIRRDLVVGEIVSPNHSELAVADVSRMWLRLSISKEDALRANEGQKVTFSAAGLHVPIESEISWISTEADPKTRTVEALAVVDNPVLDVDDDNGQRLLKANMFGIAKIRVSERPTAIVVPQKAVHWTGSEHVLFVAHPPVDVDPQITSGWTFETRTVRTGAHTAGMIEIVDGLVSEDTIVVEGGRMLQSELQRRAAIKVSRK